MAEGTDNVEDCTSSAYGERNLEVCDSSDDGVNSGREDKEYGGGDTDTLGKEPVDTYWPPIGRLCDSASCSY